MASELFVRWLQWATFASHFRIGCERDVASLGGEAEAIARKWLAFRYRLLPYLAAAGRAAERTGMPIARAMPLAFPAAPHLARYPTQFLCGDALLVAPVTRSGGDVEIAFPPGAWYDLNTRQRFPGQRLVRYRARLDQFPVFGREGWVLPLGRAVQHTGEIDVERPVEFAWVFGTAERLPGTFAGVALSNDPEGRSTLDAATGIRVETFAAATA